MLQFCNKDHEGGSLTEPAENCSVYDILSNRGSFMDMDHRLGEALQQMLEGHGSVQDCVSVLREQQAAYNEYVNKILLTLGSMENVPPGTGQA